LHTIGPLAQAMTDLEQFWMLITQPGSSGAQRQTQAPLPPLQITVPTQLTRQSPRGGQRHTLRRHSQALSVQSLAE